jgi:hypothetical protein
MRVQRQPAQMLIAKTGQHPLQRLLLSQFLSQPPKLRKPQLLLQRPPLSLA